MQRENKMNAIIYIRVSTTEQAELGYSLKVQEESCSPVSGHFFL